MTVTLLRSNALALPLADNTVDLVCTSPPYFGLRAYSDNGVTYDGQLGSEATPAEYVDALIAATREMVRVLKPSGSLFINLGDAYSAGQPLDTTFTVGDAGWLAGLIDADGTITVRRTQQPTMRAPTYEGVIAVEQMDQEAVKRAAAITGRGAICTVTGSRGRPMYRWTVSTQQARWVAERIWPWLRIKQRQALAVVELGRHREACQARGRYAPIKPEWTTYRDTISEAVRAWNARTAYDWEPPMLPVIELPSAPRRVAPKSLTGLPWRYALRCIDDLGLILRAEIVLDKKNGLPESVTDRVRRSHEQVFHFVKQPRYYSAVDEIREEHREPHRSDRSDGLGKRAYGADLDMLVRGRPDGLYNPLGKLPGSVWEYVSQPFTAPPALGIDHFASFAMSLPRRIIRGWSPARICAACGEGRRPVAGRDPINPAYLASNSRQDNHARLTERGVSQSSILRTGLQSGQSPATRITGYACSCPDTTAPTRPSVVLDPFSGTGTTCLVADVLGRHGIGLDMSHDYSRLARWRTTDPAERAKAMQVDKPPAEVDGQGDLFGEMSA